MLTVSFCYQKLWIGNLIMRISKCKNDWLGVCVATKGVVYSYIIVLLEMPSSTRKKLTHNIFVEEINLKKWMSINLPDQVWKVMDRSLLRRTSDPNITKRPSMMEIVLILQSIRDTLLGVIGSANSEADGSTPLNISSTTNNNTSKSQNSSTS